MDSGQHTQQDYRLFDIVCDNYYKVFQWKQGHTAKLT